MEPTMARRLWHVVRAVLFMLRKGMSKRKLAMDLNLLLQRGKIAGKALGKLMTAAASSSHGHASAKPAAAADAPPPSSMLAVYDQRGSAGREVEFSCSNTPCSYPPPLRLAPTKRRGRRSNTSSRRGGRGANGAEPGWYNYDAADIAKVFEILNNDVYVDGEGGEAAPALAVAATPSPALWSSFGRSPAPVRQLRITDSPFPLGAAEDGGQVDQEAEEFIKRFYQQLRTQQSVGAATPDYGYTTRPATGVAY